MIHMEDYKKKPEDHLVEKSLSRLWQHMIDHDTGFITAYRGKFTHRENQQRNTSLQAKLQAKRYGLISVEGGYIENFGSPDEKEVGEHTFFVIDLNDRGSLEKDLRNLGEEFDQDSILFVPKGGEIGYLWGTSPRKNYIPGYGKVQKLSSPVFGKSGEFVTKAGNRPFIFKPVFEDYELPDGWMSRMVCDAVAKVDWRKLD